MDNRITEDNARNFFSLLLDDIRPIPDIVDRLWTHINTAVYSDDKDAVDADAHEAAAIELGWVLGLSEEESKHLIEAECIKHYTLQSAVDRYYKREAERMNRLNNKHRSEDISV